MSGAPAMKFIADAPLGDGLKAMTKVCSHGKRLLFLSQPSRTATSPRRGHAASTCRLPPLWQLLGAAAAALGSRRLGAHTRGSAFPPPGGEEGCAGGQEG